MYKFLKMLTNKEGFFLLVILLPKKLSLNRHVILLAVQQYFLSLSMLVHRARMAILADSLGNVNSEL